MSNRESGPVIELPGMGTDVVFVVDDDPAARGGYERFLQQFGYQVYAYPFGSAALDEVGSKQPGVVVTDKDMPGMSGLQLAERVQQIDPGVRFVMVTGTGDEAAAQTALRLGITDYLKKPVDLYELTRSVQRAFMQRAVEEYQQSTTRWLQQQVDEKTREIRDVTLGALASLLNALEARSTHFKGHSQSVSLCAASIARELSLSAAEVDEIRIAGLLHDIGMIAVPDSIVQKIGALDDDERRVIEGHCRTGAEILEPLSHLGASITYVLEHHERIDGMGYPDRKRGDAISRGGQIVGLAEAWTALMEVRPFRDRMSMSDAMATLSAASGKWFAPDLLNALRNTLLRS